jgi:hypothetical protein
MFDGSWNRDTAVSRFSRLSSVLSPLKPKTKADTL